MRKIPLTNKHDKQIFALVDDEDYPELSKYSWNLYESLKKTYATRTDYSNGQRTIRMHRQVMNCDDRNILIDHIDHNGLNNQKYNLRKSSPGENARNRTSHEKSTSKYLGVHFNKDKKTKPWRASLVNKGKRYQGGYFEDEISAAKAYDLIAIKIHGEFANLNFK